VEDGDLVRNDFRHGLLGPGPAFLHLEPGVDSESPRLRTFQEEDPMLESRRRTAASTLTLALALALMAGAAAAGPGDFRHADGVGMLGAQREGLARIRAKSHERLELARRASSMGVPSESRELLDERFQDLLKEMDWIAQSTTYEGLTLLDLPGTATIQLAPGSSDCVDVHLVDVRGTTLGVDATDLLTLANARDAAIKEETAIDLLIWVEQQNCGEHALLGVDLGCPRADSYCDSTANSTGAPATIFGAGSLALSLEEPLLLYTQHCPPGRPGWFLMASGATQLPFGDGYLCLDRNVGPVVVVGSMQVVPPGGMAIGLISEEAFEGFPTLQPGSTRYFQFLFRDSGEMRSNATDGLRVTFGA